MNRSPNVDQSAKSVLLILAFLFCLAVALFSVLGFVSYQIYSARQAASLAAEAEALQAAHAQAKAREEQLRAMELHRKAEEAKQREFEALEKAKRQEEEAKRLLAQAERERSQREQEERNKAEMLRIQAENEEARRKQIELQAVQQQIATIQRGFQTWHINSSELPLLPNSDGKGQELSWRVHFLPYIGKENLYKQFHLNEPWDSEHNLKLAAQMPNAYGIQGDKTRYRCFVPVDGKSPLRVGDVKDGLNQLALIFCVSEAHAVPWTKPDSLTTSKQVTLAEVGIEPENSLMFLRADGQTQNVSRADEEMVAALASPSGGEHLNCPVGNDVLADKFLISSASDARKGIVEPTDSEPTDSETLAAMRTIARAFNQWIVAMKIPAVEKEANTSRLSWRVHLLPYLGEEELYRKFRHDEPWHSNHNSKLIAQMPAIYGGGSTSGRSRVHAFSNEQVSGFPPGLRKAEAQLQNQVCLLFGAPQNAETWTASPWIAVAPARLNAALGWPVGKSTFAGFADGNAAVLPANLHLSKLAALLSTDNKPNFNLETALESPQLPLRIEVPIQPAAPIAGLYQLPEVPIPTGGFKQPTQLESGTKKRLGNIAIAIHRHFDTYKTSPTTSKRPNGTLSELSWRVHLLPMLDQGALYEKFALDEPWDSPTNKKLIEFMPEVFQNVPGNSKETSLHVLTGEASLFGGARNWMAATDGLQNTVMLMDLPSSTLLRGLNLIGTMWLVV